MLMLLRQFRLSVRDDSRFGTCPTKDGVDLTSKPLPANRYLAALKFVETAKGRTASEVCRE